MGCLYCQQSTVTGISFCCQACSILYQGQFHTIAENAKNQLRQKWVHFDSPSVQKEYFREDPAGLKIYRFYVSDLQCSSCVHLLEKLPHFESSIIESTVYFGTSELQVKAQRTLPLSELCSLIEDLGYSPQILKTKESSTDHLLQENRRWLKQIAVAGACTGNMMMFTIPVYAGVEEPYRHLFLWLSGLLFLPILFYSAQVFYAGAWRALKTKTVNIDSAMSLALVGSFVFSTINLWRGSGAVYYDSTASFIFLILLSRYRVKKAQHKTINKLKAQDSIWDKSYLVLDGQNQVYKSPEDLVVDEIVEIQKNQVLPFDGSIVESSALWDSSLVTGESHPQVYTRGMKVNGGLRLLSPSAKVQVKTRLVDCELHQMLEMISKDSLHKSAFVQKMDSFAQKLILTVIGIGFLFILSYSFVSVEESFQRALALWVVACPCALAFAAPLTLHRALLEARKAGLLLKSVDVFEKAQHLTDIVFDKTGTLTTGRLKLIGSSPEILSPEYKRIILALERSSSHPVAFAFRAAWPETEVMDHEVSDIHEVIGEKVYGLKDGKIYSVQSGPKAQHLTIDLKVNNHHVATFFFTDELQPEAERVIHNLNAGFKLAIVSGDEASRVEDVARQLGIDSSSTFSNQKPFDKLRYIEAHPRAMLVGDGANDAPALKHAFISVAAQGSMEMSLRVADIYLLKPGLKSIEDFLRISAKARAILHRNFMIALTYNIVAGSCALLGFINPLAAAVLMPLSSLALLISTMGGWK
ncbi:MAG: heavy metal translocating P-type ATPase [Bdellovibrionales bacterium]|nr:heavy metal translocating P-type ATPase [Bdellovibrionales bacterium]